MCEKLRIRDAAVTVRLEKQYFREERKTYVWAPLYRKYVLKDSDGMTAGAPLQ